MRPLGMVLTLFVNSFISPALAQSPAPGVAQHPAHPNPPATPTSLPAARANPPVARATPSVALTSIGPRGEHFSVRVLASHLSDPWSVVYGPDRCLWITEEKTYCVSRIDPSTGRRQLVLDLAGDRHFPRYDSIGEDYTEKSWPEGGLMGLAVHPDLLKGKPWVYLVYIYKFQGVDSPGSGCALHHRGCYFTTKLVRYTWDSRREQLIDPVILCDTIPGSNDNNAGRLLIAPVDGREYLFYGIGDLGAGQFDNAARPNHAQRKDCYEGKILRFNTQPDDDPGAFDRWIPNDNPFNDPDTPRDLAPCDPAPGHGRHPATSSRSSPSAGPDASGPRRSRSPSAGPDPSSSRRSRPAARVYRQNAVWSYGHRNPEGLAYAVIDGVGRLYSSEHGPYSDDEINLIEKGKNYGHPLVIGFADGNYDGLAASVTNYKDVPGRWHTSYPLIVSERANRDALGPDYREPLKTFYPNSNAFLRKLFVYNRATGDEGHWPSEAPSSLAVDTSNAIPGWKNSLLMPSLKTHRLIRLKLSAHGDRIVGDTLTYFPRTGRIRDVAISPDGLHLYLAVDSSAFTSVPSRAELRQETYRGCIVEFTYLPLSSPPALDPRRLSSRSAPH
ncbi:MAG TPA: PQQ-dependent sugar dehydrogenase [Puia sp.]|nr:PQQ-dependent sugar dehydrogenase [Puia sp.]